METPGFVSLWLGNLQSASQVRQLTRTTYSEDGDFEGCPFSQPYRIGFFTESCLEAKFFEQPTNDLAALLAGFSYDQVIIPHFKREVGDLAREYNTVLLLYNVLYAGEVVEWSVRSSGFLRFFAAVAYDA
jgi:hypothetical protein